MGVLLRKRAEIDNGSWMDSRSGTFASSSRASLRCFSLRYCCLGAHYRDIYGRPATPSLGLSSPSRSSGLLPTSSLPSQQHFTTIAHTRHLFPPSSEPPSEPQSHTRHVVTPRPPTRRDQILHPFLPPKIFDEILSVFVPGFAVHFRNFTAFQLYQRKQSTYQSPSSWRHQLGSSRTF